MNLDAGEGWKTGRKVDMLVSKASTFCCSGQQEAVPWEAKGAGLPQQPLKADYTRQGAGLAGPLYFCPVLKRSEQTLLAAGGEQQGPT